MTRGHEIYGDRWVPTVRRWGLLLSLIVLTGAVAAHVATFVPGTRVRMSLVGPLHLLVFPPFFLMIISVLRKNLRPLRSRGGWQIRVSPEEKRRAQERQREHLKHVPAPVRTVLVLLAAYVMINFLLFVSADLGTPAGPVGARHLTDRGKFVRDLSEGEYHQIQARVVRGFSGHWMIFSAVPLAYFLYSPPSSPSDPPSAGQEVN